MKLFTYAGNVHALQSLVIAKYQGVEIEVPAFEMGKDNKTAAFLAKSPMGKVPVLETAAGCICEAAAIARWATRVRLAACTRARPPPRPRAPLRHADLHGAGAQVCGAYAC